MYVSLFAIAGQRHQQLVIRVHLLGLKLGKGSLEIWTLNFAMCLVRPMKPRPLTPLPIRGTTPRMHSWLHAETGSDLQIGTEVHNLERNRDSWCSSEATSGSGSWRLPAKACAAACDWSVRGATYIADSAFSAAVRQRWAGSLRGCRRIVGAWGWSREGGSDASGCNRVIVETWHRLIGTCGTGRRVHVAARTGSGSANEWVWSVGTALQIQLAIGNKRFVYNTGQVLLVRVHLTLVN